MNKTELLNLVDSLELPKSEYYILSGGSLLLHGLRKSTNDLDLCVSTELFNILKSKYGISEADKNEHGFYHISKDIEVIPNDKAGFKMVYKDGYPVEDLNVVLISKEKRGLPKDIADIRAIKSYFART